MSGAVALDLGTRSIECAVVEDGEIRALAVQEHPGRAMREGNVHNMAEAVASLKTVREQIGLPKGSHVAIAIAGRGLVSRRFTVELTHENPAVWTEFDIHRGENALLESTGEDELVLIGSTRAHFVNDGQKVGSLIGLEGCSASYQLLGTFLPLGRLRSKMKVVEEVGLVPTRVTSEPVALAAALFCGELPPALFLIIDIGAGTSDIALVGPEGLRAVASVPVAGDTVTEGISEKLGIGYESADRLKRDPAAAIVDLWGAERTFSAEKIRAASAAAVKTVVEGIGAAVDALLKDIDLPSTGKGSNSAKSPITGAILVGGGSLLTGISKAIARRLRLPADRVGVRSAESIPGIRDATGSFRGPAMVTCAGLIRSFDTAFRIVRIRIDGDERLVLLAPGARRSVAEIIQNAGFDPLDYFGEPGEARISASGVLAGDPGGAPIITIDGESGTLDSFVVDAVEITIRKGENAASASVESPAPESRPFPASFVLRRFVIDERECQVELPEGVSAGEALADPRYRREISTQLDLDGFVNVNGHRRDCGERARLEPTGDGDRIELIENPGPFIGDLVDFPNPESLQVIVNGERKTVRDRSGSVLVNGRRMRTRDRAPWGSSIETRRSEWYLYEILDDSPRAVDLAVNGKEAGYTALVSDGDRVTIR